MNIINILFQSLSDDDVGHLPDTIRHVRDLNRLPEGLLTELGSQST
jgi:hypothetical protein